MILTLNNQNIMTGLKKIRENGLEQLGRFYSTYRGIVVDNDLGQDNNLLKISLPSIHDTYTVIANSKNQHGSANNGFQYLLPKKGDIVFVEFEYGDPSRALWTYHGWATGERPDDFDNNTIGLLTPNGNKILLKEEGNTLHIEILENINIVSKTLAVSVEEKVEIKSELITFNEGKVGIPETTSLIKKLNALESKFNTLINTLNNPALPVIPSDGGLAGFAAVGTALGSTLTLTKESDIASEEIKQSN